MGRKKVSHFSSVFLLKTSGSQMIRGHSLVLDWRMQRGKGQYNTRYYLLHRRMSVCFQLRALQVVGATLERGSK